MALVFVIVLGSGACVCLCCMAWCVEGPPVVPAVALHPPNGAYRRCKMPRVPNGQPLCFLLATRCTQRAAPVIIKFHRCRWLVYPLLLPAVGQASPALHRRGLGPLLSFTMQLEWSDLDTCGRNCRCFCGIGREQGWIG